MRVLEARPVLNFSRFPRLPAALTLVALVATSPVRAAAPAPSPGPKVAVVAAALWSDQGVFLSEASGAARLIAGRYAHGTPATVLNNSRRALAAGPDGLATALRKAARGLDPERDVLFVILTSHGSPEGIAEKGGRTEGLLAPDALGAILRDSPVKRKVLVVSACFSGIFTVLADPETLVITAADATHPSFGCQAGARWTYFGNAFFNQALRQARSGEPLAEVFADASRLVRARELSEGFDPSNPQIAGGEQVLATLDAAR